MSPKVSILIPCYNADRWIAQAIKSALSQTYHSKEVIVIDDGSTDASLEIIKRFDGQIQWKTQTNQGGNITRNRLLELSQGKWLQYLDSDDYLKPQKIEHQVQYLSRVPQADIIYSPSVLEHWENDTFLQELLPIPEPHDAWILLSRWDLPQTGSPLWRKQAIIDVGGWKADQPCCQEHELYLRLLMAGKQFKYFDKAESVYRQWSESTVCKRDQSETRRQRLLIEDRIEQFLREQGELTSQRQYAINQARFECSRMIWLSNQQWSKQVMAQVNKTDRRFMPSGKAAPSFYRLIFRYFGFAIAEKIASAKRLLTSH